MAVSDDAHRMTRRNVRDQIREVHAVETRAHSEEADVDVRLERDRSIARPGIEDDVQRTMRRGPANPVMERIALVAETSPVREAAVDDDADRHARRQRCLEGVAVE